MPVNHTKLDLVDVTTVLRRRGYAFHSQYQTGIRLTKPDMSANGVFKETKRRKRVLLVPVSPAHLHDILIYSRNANEAADQIEHISLGVQDAPSFHQAAAPAEPAVDADTLDRLISNRVANELAKQQAINDAKIAELQDQLEKAQEPGPATSRKRKAVKKPARKRKRAVDESGLPELTEEEQAGLDEVLRQAAQDVSE
jgi:hypothetical protein